LLFSAERALAHSHAHKAALSAPNTPPHARRDQISRLRRALSYATELYNIGKSLASSSQLSQQTLTELTIYYLSVRAELSFEQSAWPEAVSDLAVRRKLLSTLAAGAKDSRDQALANEFIDQYDPLIRFCAYKMGRTESHDIEGVVADFDDEALEETLPGLSDLLKATEAETKVNEKEAGRKQLEDVSFAGDKVEMRNAEIVAVMLKVQAAIASLGEAKDESRAKAKSMRRWDTVLATLGDAEVVARRLVEDNEVRHRKRRTQADQHRTPQPRLPFVLPARRLLSRTPTSTSSTFFCRTVSNAISFS
jgi:signal recognition particle subunit SRP68